MNNKGLIKEIFVMTLADAITAIAVFFFLVPSHTSISSISGLGIILTHFIPFPLSVITMALNILLLIIGFIFCGKEFGAKTVYTSVMLPVFLGIFEKIFPDFTSLTGSQELDAVCYVLVVSIGLSMLFNMNVIRWTGHRCKDHEQVPAYGSRKGNVSLRHVRGAFFRVRL